MTNKKPPNGQTPKNQAKKEYSYEVITKDTSKEALLKFVLHCDPLVGDTQCQIRAIHLLYLYEKISEGNSLSKDEIKYINACLLLTDSKIHQHNEFGQVLYEDNDLEIVIQLYKNLTKTAITKRGAQVLIGEAREYISKEGQEFINAFLETEYPTGSQIRPFFKISEDELSLSSYRKHVLIYPQYAITKVLLDFLAEKNRLIIINLTRLQKINQTPDALPENYAIQKLTQQKLYYRTAQDASHQLIPINDEEINVNGEVGIIVSLYSYLLEDSADGVDSCFSIQDNAEFIEAFKTLNLVELFLTIFAGHIQIPSSAKGTLSNEYQEYFSVDIQEQQPNLNHPVTFQEEYKKYAKLANQYGVFSPGNKNNLSKEVAANIKHICIGSTNDNKFEI
ncbi:MAG: hypothetical protein HKM04_12080 [Legionellales bacterium]|nr:hypothetical protein [Legionellales bacterium]